VTLNPVQLSDDLTGVLEHTSLVPDSVSASVGTAAISAGELTWSGALTAGQSVTITYKVQVATDVDAGVTLKNSVDASGIDPGDPSHPIEPTCVDDGCSSNLTVGASDLTVTKVSDPKSGSNVLANDMITYTLTAKNTGDANLSAVTLTDSLADVLQYSTLIGQPQASAGKVILTGATLKWTGALAVNESVTLTYQVKIKADPTVSATLANMVIATAVSSVSPSERVHTSCETGLEDGCWSSLTLKDPTLTDPKPTDPGTDPKPTDPGTNPNRPGQKPGGGVNVSTGGSVVDVVPPMVIIAALVAGAIGSVVVTLRRRLTK